MKKLFCLTLTIGVAALMPVTATADITMCIWDDGTDLFMTAVGDYDMTNAVDAAPFFLGPVAVASPEFQVFGWSTGNEADTKGYAATYTGTLTGNMSVFEGVTIMTELPITFWNGDGTADDAITHNISNPLEGTVNESATFAGTTLADLGMVAGETVTVSWGNGGVNERATITTMTGDAYVISPLLCSSDECFNTTSDLTDSVINCSAEAIGTVFNTGTAVVSSDSLTGGGAGNDFCLELTVSSTSDLCPPGFFIDDVPADSASIIIGSVAMEPHTVTSASLTLYDLNGIELQEDDITGFLGSTWVGSFGYLFGAGTADLEIGAIKFKLAGTIAILGDVNLDGEVNLLDVAPFIDRISSGTFQLEADINEDGAVNLLDIDPFIAIFGG